VVRFFGGRHDRTGISTDRVRHEVGGTERAGQRLLEGGRAVARRYFPLTRVDASTIVRFYPGPSGGSLRVTRVMLAA